MEKSKNLLVARENYLQEIKQEKEKALKNAPEGSLRICNHGKRTQYYLRNDPKDFNGTYIREKDIQLAQKLAQKDYDKKVLQAVEKELGAIQRYIGSCPTTSAEEIYESLHKERQKLIIPISETDEEFAKHWENVEYQGKEFYSDIPEFYTAKGERVRSKSEVIIADALNRQGIPYRYEYPVYLEGMGIVYPDFTVLNVRQRKELYLEHFGMMDDAEYAENAIQKILCYERNGIFPGDNLILTYETRKTPINQKMIMLIMQKYLQ